MSGKNTITRTVRRGSVFESAKAVISSATNFQQGDLLVFDSSTHLLRKPTVETEGNLFAGVARETLVNGVMPAPYSTDVDSSRAIADVPGPDYGVVAKCHLKASDTLNPGDVVYLYPIGWTNRGVQASGTKAVGVYQGAAVTGGPSSSPTEVEVLLGHRYPGDTLVF